MSDVRDMALGEIPATGRRLPPRWMLAVLALIVALSLLALLFFNVVLPAVARHSLLAPGTPAPAIQLGSVDPVADSTHRTVLVEFFSTTCSDCSTENSSLCSFVHATPSVEVVEIEAGGHSAADVARWKAALGSCGTAITFLVDTNGSVASAYHVLGTPTLYVLRGGRIEASATGVEDPSTLITSASAGS